MSKTRKYESYYEYCKEVVDKCSHSWVIMESKDFRSWKISRYYGTKESIPTGKHIKIVPARCKSYSCPICGAKKVKDLLDRLKNVDLKGYRFFTLTLKNQYSTEDTEKNFARITKCFNKLNKKLRKDKRFKGLEYFRVVEIGLHGNVHMHGIWNKFIPQIELSKIWLTITKDSYRTKLEAVKCKGDALRYLFKYITKNARDDFRGTDPKLFDMDILNTAALFYENGKRRYQASRNFFPKVVKIAGNYLPFYFESSETDEVEKVIISLVKEFGLKKEHFDFDVYYGSDLLLDDLFNSS